MQLPWRLSLLLGRTGASYSLSAELHSKDIWSECCLFLSFSLCWCFSSARNSNSTQSFPRSFPQQQDAYICTINYHAPCSLVSYFPITCVRAKLCIFPQHRCCFKMLIPFLIFLFQFSRKIQLSLLKLTYNTSTFWHH